jgi:hypothetical protein
VVEGEGEGCGVSFVFVGRPPSGNKNVGRGGALFRSEIQRLHAAAGGTVREGPCYGIVYYFVRGYDPSRDADADNVAKRLWDALEGSAYADDHVLRLRIAGVVEVGGPSKGAVHARELDLAPLDLPVAALLLSLAEGGAKRFLYVEVGPARASMFRFDLASEGRVL